MRTEKRLYKDQPCPSTKLPFGVLKHRKETISLLLHCFTVNYGSHLEIIPAESIRKDSYSNWRTCRTVSACPPFYPKKSLS